MGAIAAVYTAVDLQTCLNCLDAKLQVAIIRGNQSTVDKLKKMRDTLAGDDYQEAIIAVSQRADF